MNSLINTNFNRTYNPTGQQNALSDIKRLLTSRDTATQAKACGYLIEVISKYDKSSTERSRLVNYLLENDITVFLCEVTSNLDFNLFRSVLQCLRLIWTEPQFFAEEHAPHTMAAVIRALTHFSAINSNALDICLHFLCDLLRGINITKSTSPLSHQSAFNEEQLLATFNFLTTRIKINSNSKSILSSALVLQELISYQPENLIVHSSIARDLGLIIKKWLELLVGGLNHHSLVGEEGEIGMFLVLICQIGINSLGLVKLFERGNRPNDFVNNILNDKNETENIKQVSMEIKSVVHQTVTEIVIFFKDNFHTLSTEEYATFLKFILNIYHEFDSEVLSDFSDVLLSKGYLAALPKFQIERNDIMVRKLSTLILGEMLKALTEKYLFVNVTGSEEINKDIQLGLAELQHVIEKPQNMGVQLQKNQPYSLLIYIYFYCQSSENPEESTAPLLPFLVEHILRLPKTFRPPSCIIKALWLVFAMSTISNGSLASLDERVYLERATSRLVGLLQPHPAPHYTHHPALLFWAFTSLRIPNYTRLNVLAEWLKTEESLPDDLTKEPLVWELLLDVLTQIKDSTVVANCMKALNLCLEGGDDGFKQDFGNLIWSMLPGVLSRTLINCENEIDTNICYLLDIATNLPPPELENGICLKIAVLLTTIYSKTAQNSPTELKTKYHYDCVCLNMCLLLLQYSNDQKDTKVLLTYTNKLAFLTNVLACMNSSEEEVASAALRLLSYIVYYFQKNQYQAKSHLQIKTATLVRSLRRDGAGGRGAALLQLVYTVLSAGAHSPLLLAYSLDEAPSQHHQCYALRALMFRIQNLLCCRDSEHRSSAGWKTLSSIFKHAIVYKNDSKLVGLLTCQPWIYTLTRFQLAQGATIEFLTFLKNWLILLKISLKKNRQDRKILVSKHSLITRTMMMIKKSIDDDDHKETRNNVLNTVTEILEECTSRK